MLVRTEWIDELGLTSGKPAHRPGTKDTVRNLPACEDSRSEEEERRFQLHAGKMLYHSLDDYTVQLDAAMVRSSTSNPTFAAMARLVRVVQHCVHRPR